MVVIKLIGGLGNQMFQYAAGRRLAYVLGVELKLDISWFENQNLRKYDLWVFNIQEHFASPEEVALLTVQKQGITERVVRCALRKQPKRPRTYIREKNFHFDPDIVCLSEGVYLDGYWQSEKYFKDIEAVIQHEFAVNSPQTGKNKELAELIASCETVSLHIRRGDYVSNPQTNQVHGICDLNYYFRCVEQLTQKVKNPHFFIFSDESEWARENLNLPNQTTFVDHNRTDKNYEDMRLMSQCKHHIIANSAFSWWGAWLNQNPCKIVLAPKKWFNSVDYNTNDLILDGWLKI